MTADERLTRIENVVEKLADKSDRLDAVMLTLAEAQIKLTNRVDTLTQRMDTIADRLDTIADRLDTVADRLDTMADRLDTMADRLETVAQQSADGDRRLGERIESLVSTIGEFIRNRPATG